MYNLVPLVVTIATDRENAGQEAGPAAGQFYITLASNGLHHRAMSIKCMQIDVLTDEEWDNLISSTKLVTGEFLKLLNCCQC